MLLSIVLRLAVCCGLTWLAWRAIGPAGLAMSAPLFGIAFAKPLLESASNGYRALRRHVYRHVDGRHYAHRGHAIDIAEDAAHFRWLKVSDVRRLVPDLPGDRVLQSLFPTGVRAWRTPPGLRISAEALAGYLAKATDPDSLRLRRWLESAVAYPARRQRERRHRAH